MCGPISTNSYSSYDPDFNGSFHTSAAMEGVDYSRAFSPTSFFQEPPILTSHKSKDLPSRAWTDSPLLDEQINASAQSILASCPQPTPHFAATDASTQNHPQSTPSPASQLEGSLLQTPLAQEQAEQVSERFRLVSSPLPPLDEEIDVPAFLQELASYVPQPVLTKEQLEPVILEKQIAESIGPDQQVNKRKESAAIVKPASKRQKAPPVTQRTQLETIDEEESKQPDHSDQLCTDIIKVYYQRMNGQEARIPAENAVISADAPSSLGHSLRTHTRMIFEELIDRSLADSKRISSLEQQIALLKAQKS
jgi:hypothetical protein